jgi:hypothetical protein
MIPKKVNRSLADRNRRFKPHIIDKNRPYSIIKTPLLYTIMEVSSVGVSGGATLESGYASEPPDF